jgi:hypothetical protein
MSPRQTRRQRLTLPEEARFVRRERFSMQRTTFGNRAARFALTGLIGTALLIATPLTGAAQNAASPCAAATPSSSAPTATPAPTETALPTQPAVATEDNPPGDIPDNQAFVTYRSAAGGYAISMPEGWARTENGPNVSFADKLHTFTVEIACTAAPPTVDSANGVDVPALAAREPAFALVAVKAIDLPAGPTVLIQYQTNSAPDEVTGKQIRLDVDRYELFKDGRLAAISLRVPAGSDNVDVSNQVSRSFQWTA